MSHKTTKQDLEALALSRNQELLELTNLETPSKGDIIFKCNTCGYSNQTSVKSYKNARTTGCATCKSIKAQKQGNKRLVNVPILPKHAREKKSLYDFKNQEELINFLEKENNPYSIFILEKLKQPRSSDEFTETHHIIPKHAGGPDSAWNLVELTKADHYEAHRLRYATYHEQGDFTFLKKTNPMTVIDPVYQAELRRRAIKSDETRKAEKKGIYAEGVSAKGGKASAAVKSKQRDLSHKGKMSLKVYNVLYRGSVWWHSSTETSLKLESEEVITLSELQDRFIQALPENNKDRELLINAKAKKNTSSGFSKVIRGERKTSYGWELISYDDPKASIDDELFADEGYNEAD